jgi:GT2 family glycosyltransferase
MKKIIFCIPGNNFSVNFLLKWTELSNWLLKNNISYLLSSNYVPIISASRDNVLGISEAQKTKLKKPFDNQVDYTHIMWIDSDMVFEPEHFKSLLDRDLPIVSGLYRWQQEGTYTAKINCCWANKKTIEKANGSVIKAKFAGMGWMLVKKEVYDKIEYPYHDVTLLDEEGYSRYVAEDEYFCYKAAEAGYDINIDTSVIVGHEKKQILY